MLYIFLTIIIGLLIKLIYFPRDKGVEAQTYWNNLFGRKIHILDYRKDDPRNKTHPEEMVRMKDGSLSHRKLAMLLDVVQEKTPKEIADEHEKEAEKYGFKVSKEPYSLVSFLNEGKGVGGVKKLKKAEKKVLERLKKDKKPSKIDWAKLHLEALKKIGKTEK